VEAAKKGSDLMFSYIILLFVFDLINLLIMKLGIGDLPRFCACATGDENIKFQPSVRWKVPEKLQKLLIRRLGTNSRT
jgi:hypothetical protein